MWSIMVYHDILWSITWYIKWFIMVYITIKWSVIPIMIYCGILWSIMVILRYIYYEDGIDYDLLWLGHIRTMDMKLSLWLHDHLNQKMQSGQTWIRHVYQHKIAGCREPCTNATRCSEMISPNSFCGFFFTRVIDMNLDPPFLQNPWTKKHQFDLSTERPWVPKSPYKNTLYTVKHYASQKLAFNTFP